MDLEETKITMEKMEKINQGLAYLPESKTKLEAEIEELQRLAYEYQYAALTGRKLPYGKDKYDSIQHNIIMLRNQIDNIPKIESRLKEEKLFIELKLRDADKELNRYINQWLNRHQKESLDADIEEAKDSLARAAAYYCLLHNLPVGMVDPKAYVLSMIGLPELNAKIEEYKTELLSYIKTKYHEEQAKTASRSA